MTSLFVRLVAGVAPVAALACGLVFAAGSSAQARERPQGDWHRYCKDADLRGDILEADCRKRNGGWRRNTRINFDRCPGNAVTVNDGYLVCQRGHNYGHGGYPGHYGWDNDRWDRDRWDHGRDYGWNWGRNNDWDRRDWDRRDWDRRDWDRRDWDRNRHDNDRRDNDRHGWDGRRDNDRHGWDGRRDNDRHDWDGRRDDNRGKVVKRDDQRPEQRPAQRPGGSSDWNKDRRGEDSRKTDRRDDNRRRDNDRDEWWKRGNS